MCKGNHVNFGQKTVPWGSTLLARYCGAAGIRLQMNAEFNEETKSKTLYRPINTVDTDQVQNIAMDDVDADDPDDVPLGPRVNLVDDQLNDGLYVV